jgi:hypothetical protein
MITFKNIKWRNFLSTGDQFNEIQLDKVPTSIVCGKNGFGKCFCINTKVTLRNKKTGEIIETTIGEFYEIQKE